MHTVQATVEEGEESEWASMEAAAIAVFSLEIALRLVSCENIFDYFFPKRQGRRRANLMNWIDVVAVIPFYIGIAISNEDAVPGLQVLRVLRLVRVFRLFRVSKTSIAVFGRTMRSSAQPMSMLIFFLVMGLVVFSR